MPKQGLRYAAKVDLKKEAYDQPQLHNRWHPDISFCGTIKNNEVVKIQCVDWTGGQIGNNDSADDVRDVDLTRVHYLTGPFEIETAEPGDVLVVEIQDVQPLQEEPWGFTGIFAKDNGAPKPSGTSKASTAPPATSPASASPASSTQASWAAPPPPKSSRQNEREGALIKECSHMGRDVALPPLAKNVHVGHGDDKIKEQVGKEGARTIPGRPEHGGNCDIKNLSRGSKVYLPVHVKGAKFSVGDLHFSQGDGEISFCGAIEMAGEITIKFTVMKGGVEHLAMKSPIYIPGPVEPQFGPGRYIYFEGFSVDEKGKQYYLDTTVAYRQTCLRVFEYLRRFGRFCPLNLLHKWGGFWFLAKLTVGPGYDDYQIYLLLSCAPVQGHVAGIVDIPNSCTTMGLPMDIFDFDIRPEAKPEKRDLGSCAFVSS
ncbi:hypothetical protein LTR02_017264 [Friedmanniomyces endolithicus]|nr:hypothetical protein LTR02_017264 [Friedmanniomyces endolithicus]